MNTREFGDKLQDWQKSASETARNFGQAADDYVRGNAWTTVTLAVLAGCLLGFVLGARRH